MLARRPLSLAHRHVQRSCSPILAGRCGCPLQTQGRGECRNRTTPIHRARNARNTAPLRHCAPRADAKRVTWGCITHPLLDRRLVETTLAIPQRRLNRPGHTRDLMRRALVGLLPASVLNRRSKGYASPPLMRVFRPRIEEMRHHIAELELVRGGWLAESKLADLVSSFREGRRETLSLMLSALNVESWLKAHGAHGSTPPTHTVSAAPIIPKRKEVKSHAVREA
ncbi:MAG: asparagine synthase-related protein [Vicinamibacteraceae bacterium]